MACGRATIASELKRATLALQASASARLDAELLLASALALTRTDLYREPERPLDDAAAARFETLLNARASGMPVAYLRGRAEFWSLELEVTPDVLVPRAETELLVEIALELAPPHAVLADLGTGSGAIALALGHERPDALVVASDKSARALAIAAKNRARLHLEQVVLVQSDWLRPFRPDAFDLIVANPPYIAPDERAQLPLELGFEPAHALFAADAGLADLHAIIEQSTAALRAGGWLVLEHGASQAPAVSECMRRENYTDIETRRDLAGRDRVTLGRRRA